MTTVNISARVYTIPSVDFPIPLLRGGKKKVVGFETLDPTVDLKTIEAFNRTPDAIDWEEVTADVREALKQLGAQPPSCFLTGVKTKATVKVGTVSFFEDGLVESESCDPTQFLDALYSLTLKGNIDWIRDAAEQCIPLVKKHYGVSFGNPNGGNPNGTDGFR